MRTASRTEFHLSVIRIDRRDVSRVMSCRTLSSVRLAIVRWRSFPATRAVVRAFHTAYNEMYDCCAQFHTFLYSQVQLLITARASGGSLLTPDSAAMETSKINGRPALCASNRSRCADLSILYRLRCSPGATAARSATTRHLPRDERTRESTQNKHLVRRRTNSFISFTNSYINLRSLNCGLLAGS